MALETPSLVRGFGNKDLEETFRVTDQPSIRPLHDETQNDVQYFTKQNTDDWKTAAQASLFDLQSQYVRIAGQKATVDNIRQLQQIKQNYAKLENFISQNENSNKNELAIDQFQKEEQERIQMFGGDEKDELNLYLDTVVNQARNQNLTIETKEVERNAWEAVREEQVNFKSALQDGDLQKAFDAITTSQSMLNRLVGDGIIDKERADIYTKAIVGRSMKHVLGVVKDQVGYVTQTQGVSAAKNYLSSMESLFSPLMSALDDQSKKAFDLLKQQVEFNSVDLTEVKNNYNAVTDNFIKGYSTPDAFEDASRNLLTNLNKKQKLDPANRNKYKSDKNKIIGSMVLIKAMTDEFNKLGMTETLKLLNPALPKEQVIEEFEKLFNLSQNKTPEAVKAALNMRNVLLSNIAGKHNRSDIQSMGRDIIHFFGAKEGRGDNILLVETDDIKGLENAIKNDYTISRMFNLQENISKRNLNTIKNLLSTTQDEQPRRQLKNMLSKVAGNDAEITKLILKTEGTNTAQDKITPNVNSFIDTYPTMFHNLQNPQSKKRATELIETSPNFPKVTGKLSKMLSKSGLIERLMEMQEVTGYDLSVIQNSLAIDTALGIMQGQFGFNDEIVMQADMASKDGEFTNPVLQKLASSIDEKVNSMMDGVEKVGRTYVMADSADMFAAKNVGDIRFLGVFDEVSGQLGRIKDWVSRVAVNPVHPLRGQQQNKVDNFIKKYIHGEVENITGRIKIAPAENGFYKILLDNGFGGVEEIMAGGQPMIIHPTVYAAVMARMDIQGYSVEDDEKTANAVIEILKLSNGL